MYNEPITIQELDAGTIPDAHGHIDATSADGWAPYHTAFADVFTDGSREFWKANRVSNSVSHIWSMQWDTTAAAATPRMRLKHGTDLHYISSVEDVDQAHRVVRIQTRRTV